MPDIQTGMQTVAKQLGMHKSEMERVWLWVQGHPDAIVTQIQEGTKMGLHRVQDTVYNLTQRGMLLADKKTIHLQRIGAAMPVKAVRKSYRVNPKMLGVYELWPSPGKRTKPPVQAPVEPVVAQQQQVTKAQSLDEFDLDNMSIGKARKLYEQLKKLFG